MEKKSPQNFNIFLIIIVTSLMLTIKVTSTFSTNQSMLTSSATMTLDLDTRAELTQKLKFTPAQVSSVDELVAQAKKDNLPTELLIKRIKEGITKKVDYQSIHRVITKKIAMLTQANRLIKERFARGNISKKRDAKYEIQLLAELLERELAEDDFVDLAEVSRLLKIPLEETIVRAQLIVVLAEKEISHSLAKEIVLGTMKKKFDDARKLIRLLIEAKTQDVATETGKNIILEGVAKNRSYQWIRDKVLSGTKEAIREEIRKEVIKEQEREQRR